MLKVFLILIFLGVLVGNNISAQSERMNIVREFTNESLRSILDDFCKDYDTRFIFRDELIDDVNLTCSVSSNTYPEAIKTIFNKAGFEYLRFDDKSFIILGKEKTKKQNVRTVLLEEKPVVDYDTSYSVTMPKVISDFEFMYPDEAVRSNISGNVKVTLLINAAGEVVKSMLQSSSGSSLLDSVALDYSNKLKFLPALANGKPHSTWLAMRFEFCIVDKERSK